MRDAIQRELHGALLALRSGASRSFARRRLLWAGLTGVGLLGATDLVAPTLANQVAADVAGLALIIAAVAHYLGNSGRRRRYRRIRWQNLIALAIVVVLPLLIVLLKAVAILMTVVLVGLLPLWLNAAWMAVRDKWRSRSWASQSSNPTPQWSVLDHLDGMSPLELEQVVADLFVALGHESARLTVATGDYGADVLVDEFTDAPTVVQVKLLSGHCGVDAVQEVAAARAHYKATSAVCVAPRGFTANAYKLALSTGVDMWDQERLLEKVRQAERLAERSSNPVRVDDQSLEP